jgi:transmembrane sensor
VAGFGPDAGSMMNTLRTPRGGQYRLVLPDGTQAWLNAASSISYPAAFTTNERRVRISGEVYFEVAVDKAKPFVAEASDGSLVQVLGTSFDIDSYLDEGVVKTTLLTGKVRVSAGSGATMVAPGEQAQESPDKLTLVDKVDLEKVMAWKNGFFDFQDATLEEVMRQLERWYDIKVEYPKGIPAGQFEGQISRNINLADLLKILARADVKFKIEEGRRLLVLP